MSDSFLAPWGLIPLIIFVVIGFLRRTDRKEWLKEAFEAFLILYGMYAIVFLIFMLVLLLFGTLWSNPPQNLMLIGSLIVLFLVCAKFVVPGVVFYICFLDPDLAFSILGKKARKVFTILGGIFLILSGVPTFLSGNWFMNLFGL